MTLLGKALTFAFAGFTALPALGQNVAQDYPVKSVRWIVTFPPGASNDIVVVPVV